MIMTNHISSLQACGGGSLTAHLFSADTGTKLAANAASLSACDKLKWPFTETENQVKEWVNAKGHKERQEKGCC